MLKQDLANLLAAKFDVAVEDTFIEYPRDHTHGDYASPIALKLANQAGKNPRQIAEDLVGKLGDLDEYELTIAGPGFINFKLKDDALVAELTKLLADRDGYRLPEPTTQRPIICEYSSPNVAKPLGAHHLLGTVIGQSIANIYAYLGYKTIRISHVGDWGSQFGKLIYAYREWGNKEQIEANPIPELLKLYVEFHDRLEQDESLGDKARAIFKKLEDDDPENWEIFRWIVEVSNQDVDRTYEALGGINFDYKTGESFYKDMMEPLVQEGIEQGIFIEGDGGALIATFSEAEGFPPAIIKRSDGATVYITRDLATAEYRINEYDPDRILYINDVAQKLHFQQLFSIVKRLPSIHTEKTNLINVMYGRMSFADQKMSTRKGNIILLDELIKEATERSLAVVQAKGTELSLDEQNSVAKMIGAGGLKYAVLSQNRMTNLIFDWDKVINLEGNSAVYLQYTFARANSVLRDAGALEFDTNIDVGALTEHERAVLRLLPKFPEMITLAAAEYKPHFVAEYLFALAQAFNAFYANDAILKAEGPQRQLRLAICQAVCQIIKDGLKLLAGIEVPERM